MAEQLSLDKMVGTTLGKYRLEQLLEQGGLEPVFFARADTGSTPYRLRVLALPAELTGEARIVYLGHFQQQAHQIAELQHPSIVPLLDYGHQLGILYLVSPHLSALSLSTLLTQNGPMDMLVAGSYLDQVAAALEYAHEHAVLHRNLTTGCILVKPDGNLVVADFGVMRLLELDGQGAPPWHPPDC